MPNKYLEKKGVALRKQQYKVTNWSDYNKSLKRRGDIELWLTKDVLLNWYEKERIYDGTGSSKQYTDFAITICHEIRQVFKLPLRQTEGFINSLFSVQDIELTCPTYTTLSKRLGALNLRCPRYRKVEKPDDDLVAIAIDSTGLKRFGRDEWHQERHKVSARRSFRKLHIAVDESHYIQGSKLTDQYVSDQKVVGELAAQISLSVDHYSADGAYDKESVYEILSSHSPAADIVIPPSSNAVINKAHHPQRNRNVIEIKTYGRMGWQRQRDYGRRNYSELCIQRYKRILGRAMHAREMSRQEQEAMIGCGVLNKMTSVGMPVSCRVA